jgi:hypothetical protein
VTRIRERGRGVLDDLFSGSTIPADQAERTLADAREAFLLRCILV